MQLVLAGAEAYEGVVITTELPDHVAEGEDGAEDELGVIGGVSLLLGLVAGRSPYFGVDALRCWEGKDDGIM